MQKFSALDTKGIGRIYAKDLGSFVQSESKAASEQIEKMAAVSGLDIRVIDEAADDNHVISTTVESSTGNTFIKVQASRRSSAIVAAKNNDNSVEMKSTNKVEEEP